MARSRRVLTTFAGIRVAGATRTDWRAGELRLLPHQHDFGRALRNAAPVAALDFLEAPRIAARRHQQQFAAVEPPLRDIEAGDSASQPGCTVNAKPSRSRCSPSVSVQTGGYRPRAIAQVPATCSGGFGGAARGGRLQKQHADAGRRRFVHSALDFAEFHQGLAVGIDRKRMSFSGNFQPRHAAPAEKGCRNWRRTRP